MIRSSFAVLGHLAIWVGFYVGGCVLLASLLLHGRIPWGSLAIAVPVSIGTYLVDRVRLRPEAIDPSDQMAHQARLDLLMKWGGSIRLLAFGLIGLAMAMAADRSPWVLIAVVGAPIGVILYSHRGFSRRPKDQVLFKNACVSISIVALVMLLECRDASAGSLIAVAGFLLLHVFSDAMLCDVDDAEADRRYGTVTIPGLIGTGRTWLLAIALNAIALVWIASAAALGLCPLGPSILFGAFLLAATVMVHAIPANRTKDLIDLKLPLAVVLAWSLVVWIGL
ncbi:MAG: hypothetical protein CMJ40_01950 [Phycisphaerae bacterium]|nr:hypothetical protein [Phycisphaerae bacterium]